MTMATIVIDKGHCVVREETRTLDFGNVEDALLTWDALTRTWSESGWCKKYEVWQRGEEWQQRVLVVGDTTFVEGDGDDE